MSKKCNLLTVILFCGFLAGMCLMSLVLPDRKFSQMENRNLQPLPQLTLKRFTEGKFMTDAETYTADHIALRDQWVALKSLSEKLMGKHENNGVYFGAEHTLLSRVNEPDVELLDKNMGHLNALASSSSVPVYFGLIPSSACVWQDRLPAGAPTADEDYWISRLYEQSAAVTVDISSQLKAHRDEAIYYRTDHHWTSLGALHGANAIFQAMGLEELDPASFDPQVVSDSFCGTTYSSSAGWWTPADSVTQYVPEEGVEVISNFTGTPEPGSLYVPSHLEAKNKYPYFLGGNQPLCILSSQAASTDQRVLVIRDSYCDTLAPFLTQRFSQIHLFDLRYNRTSISEYIQANGIDSVLVLYSLPNYIEDTNQFLLER